MTTPIVGYHYPDPALTRKLQSANYKSGLNCGTQRRNYMMQRYIGEIQIRNHLFWLHRYAENAKCDSPFRAEFARGFRDGFFGEAMP